MSKVFQKNEVLSKLPLNEEIRIEDDELIIIDKGTLGVNEYLVVIKRGVSIYSAIYSKKESGEWIEEPYSSSSLRGSDYPKRWLIPSYHEEELCDLKWEEIKNIQICRLSAIDLDRLQTGRSQFLYRGYRGEMFIDLIDVGENQFSDEKYILYRNLEDWKYAVDKFTDNSGGIDFERICDIQSYLINKFDLPDTVFSDRMRYSDLYGAINFEKIPIKWRNRNPQMFRLFLDKSSGDKRIKITID